MIRDGHSNEGSPDNNEGKGCGARIWAASVWAGISLVYGYIVQSLLVKLVLAFILPQVIIWAMHVFYLGEYHPDQPAVMVLLVISSVSVLLTLLAYSED